MVNSYTNTNVAVASSAAIPFVNNRHVVGCGSAHTPGSTTIGLKKSGYYLVKFNASVSAASTGLVQAQLYNNGVAVPGALSAETITTAENISAISFATVVRVLNSCNCLDNTVNLTVVNNGLASTYTNAEISIIRLN